MSSGRLCWKLGKTQREVRSVLWMLKLSELYVLTFNIEIFGSQAIDDARAVLGSSRLASIMNIRDKHLAHSLETTRREKNGPIQPMKNGDETELRNASKTIV